MIRILCADISSADMDIYRRLYECAAPENPQHFYEVRTGKESYLKYTGRGLCKELYYFSVLHPEGNVRYMYRILPGGYSLSLCTTELESEF